jgi:hypothetical protein
MMNWTEPEGRMSQQLNSRPGLISLRLREKSDGGCVVLLDVVNETVMP